MEAIADAAGCTKPTLYAHFGSKQSVYLAALRREARSVRGWLFDAYQRATGQRMREQIHAGMAAIFSYAEAHPEGFRLLFATEAPGHAKILDDLWSAVIARIDGSIRTYLADRQLPAGEHTRTLAAASVGAAVFSVRQAYLSDPTTPPGRVLEIVSAFTDAAFTHLDPDLFALTKTPSTAPSTGSGPEPR
jgi:AcrR family transcriptional regulator